MCCRIADIAPLAVLARDTGVLLSCHSPGGRKGGCLHSLAPSSGGKIVRGVMGASLGYCQALFQREGRSPGGHTERVISLLTQAKAPWSRSHEIFWGHRSLAVSATEFLNSAIAPLLETGRLPVVITGFQSDECQPVSEIFESQVAIAPQETILVRLLLDPKSLGAARDLVQRLVILTRETGRMPQFWPLFQGTESMSHSSWKEFLELLGDNRQYLTLAVNPFTSSEVFFLAGDKVVVAQIPIGLAEGIRNDGLIQLAPGMNIMGASPEANYNLFSYLEQLAHVRGGIKPTLIILGPALAGWTEKMNRDRVAAIAGLLPQATEILWSGISSADRGEILALSA